MTDIRMIAMDLDQTLLNSKKELSEKNRAALQRAADRGIFVVPATGRMAIDLPEEVDALPFVRYVITMNGAQVFDRTLGREVVEPALLPNDRAREIMSYLDTLPVVYDCYMNDRAYMTKDHYDRIEDYLGDPYFVTRVKNIRTPVPDLKEYIAADGSGLQKMQLFTKDPSVRRRALKELPERFDHILATSASSNNVEINDEHANKGEALAKLAQSLGLSMDEVMAIGDGLNDITMLRMAGLGVAMGNAEEEVLSVADAVTATCDEDGVAQAVLKYALQQAL